MTFSRQSLIIALYPLSHSEINYTYKINYRALYGWYVGTRNHVRYSMEHLAKPLLLYSLLL
jgi:hypothetical protein